MRKVPRTRVVAMAVSLVVAVAIGSSARAALGPPERSVADRPPAGVHGHTIGHAHPNIAGADVDPLADADLDVLQGEEAVEELVESEILEEVAADAGLAPEELVEEFLADPSLFVTEEGLLGYVDAFPLGGAALSTEALTAVPLGVDVFSLSSRPGAARTLYLDLDGHTTNAPSPWSSSATSLPIVSDTFVSSPPTDAQRRVIHEIWQRVSEDFAPFDINVTTIEPDPQAIIRTDAADGVFGQRIVISPTNWVQTQEGASTILGIALLNSFGSGADTPAFVFTANSAGVTLPTKLLAEAVSHEAGHTFGLRHDGLRAWCGAPVGEYYDGHDGWAPIMGRSISPLRPVSQWSRGEYRLANNSEDDVARIRSFTGPAPDDHGNTNATATGVGLGTTTTGVIGINDVDVFAVQLEAGSPLGVVLRPPPGMVSWANLYASVTVRNVADSVVATGLPSAPSTRGWQAPVSIASLPAGRYTIEVRPTPHFHPFTGFSTYGSMGAYELTVTAGGVDPAPPAPAPPLVPPVPRGDCFEPVTPDRLLDTRTGFGGSTRLSAGRTIVLQVTGRGGVPTGATAAVLGVVADQPIGSGFLTTFPCTPTRPTASTLNFVTGQTVANTAISTLSPAGQICIYAHATTHVVVDVTGWIGPEASARFTPTTPTRVADTRSGFGGVTRLPAGGTIEVDLSSWVPPTARAVSLNVTSDAASAPGFATVYPCSASRPPTSTINFVARDVRPNNTIVGLGANRRVCIYSLSSTDIVVDLTGHFGPDGLSYLPAAPNRLLDTRETVGFLPPSGVVAYRPATAALGGATAVAAAVNVTATEHVSGGFVTTFDCVTRTNTSSVNAIVGQNNANGAIVPLLNGLDSCLFTQSGGHLVVDLNGWWVS